MKEVKVIDQSQRQGGWNLSVINGGGGVNLHTMSSFAPVPELDTLVYFTPDICFLIQLCLNTDVESTDTAAGGKHPRPGVDSTLGVNT